MSRFKLGSSVILAAALVAASSSFADENRYWDLGVGCYYGGTTSVTELDVAMYDWLYLCFGNISATEETTQQLNRILKLNPNLKIVIRVWPIMSLGDCEENRYQATFLHYLYKPGVKAKLLENIRRQVSVVLDHIDRPENVVGLTFLEELPAHFSGHPFMRKDPGEEVTWDLERFRTEIEAERGRPLVWDEETRAWWGEKWVEVINEIHAEMKACSDDRLVFYYQQTNHTSLDMVPEGTPLSTFGLMPVRWSDIIQPGLCDGFFAYANNQTIWDRYLKLARDNDWLFFSQASHPGFMRLCDWNECKALAKTKMPQNLGYFFFCQGNCAATQAWNADRDIPLGPEWNTRGVSVKLHIRKHLAEQGIGRDVLKRQPALGLQADVPLDSATPGGVFHPRVIVENTREPSMYLDPADAVARAVTVRLDVGDGYSIDPEKSPPATIRLGDLKPGEKRLVDWWVSVGPDADTDEPAAFVLTGEAEGAEPTTLRIAGDTSIPFALAHEIGASGTQWTEAAFRMTAGEAQPRIIIDALRGPVRNPSVSDGNATIRYQGRLDAATQLVIDPTAGARVTYSPLVDDDGASRADPADASGFRGVDDGYLIHRIRVGLPASPDVPLRVGVSGMATGDGQSLVLLRFATPDGDKDLSVLVNRFAEEWREVAQTVSPPPGAESLEWVYLSRFRSLGKVWYGPVRVERADAADGGIDVSDSLHGGFPSLSRSAFRTFTYTDDSPPSVAPRVRVQLEVPEQ